MTRTKLILLSILAIGGLVLLVTPGHVSRAASLSNENNTGDNTVTYNKDIAPILYKNCTSCHRAGEVAPFTLLDYKDAAKHAQQLALVTQSRYMPPWKPEPGYGDFQDVRHLSDAEIALIKRWADNGAPEGKPSDRPQPPVFTDGWQMGTPDQILKMPEAYKLYAEGRDVYQCFVLPLN